MVHDECIPLVHMYDYVNIDTDLNAKVASQLEIKSNASHTLQVKCSSISNHFLFIKD